MLLWTTSQTTVKINPVRISYLSWHSPYRFSRTAIILKQRRIQDSSQGVEQYNTVHGFCIVGFLVRSHLPMTIIMYWFHDDTIFSTLKANCRLNLLKLNGAFLFFRWQVDNDNNNGRWLHNAMSVSDKTTKCQQIRVTFCIVSPKTNPRTSTATDKKRGPGYFQRNHRLQ